jgi:hypothetical protein
MRRILIGAVATACFTSLSVEPAAADTQTTTFPFTEAVINSCNDDLTVINGTETITMTITDLGGGRLEFSMRDQQTGSGSGLTGKRYTYSKVFTDRFTTRRQPLLRSSTSTFLTLKKVGGPRSENMDVDVTERMTIDTSTGEVLRVAREFEAECE